MPHAWFYYVVPLAFPAIFTVVGVVILWRAARGHRDKHGKKLGTSAAISGILFALIGGSLSLAVILTSPMPWERQRIFNHVFQTPPEQIQKFVIRFGTPKQPQHPPLPQTDVVIDDPAQIRQIAESLQSATEIWPNHPRSKWTARVKMVTNAGTYFFHVNATVAGDSNGTLVGLSTKPGGGGWNLGDRRANGLDTILENTLSPGSSR